MIPKEKAVLSEQLEEVEEVEVKVAASELMGLLSKAGLDKLNKDSSPEVVLGALETSAGDA